jgi:CheY-like chemotaxis protein
LALSHHGALAGLYILVLEDDRDSRQILRQLLTYLGGSVTAVATPTEALSLLRQIEPDVVLVDMMLGRDDGLAFLQRARKRGSRVPMIAMSAQDFDREVLEGAGFVAYLRKPLDHGRLVDTVLAVATR